MIERITAFLGPEMTTRLMAMAAGLAALAGCPLHGDGNHAEVRDEPAAEVPLGEMIECALDGSLHFAAECKLERVHESGRDLLVVRHPDGGFRRVVIGADGRTLDSADGAFAARGVLAGGVFTVAVAGDAYRLPVAVAAARPGI